MLLKDALKADLDEKIHRLEEDKHHVDFSNVLWAEGSFGGASHDKRGSRKRKSQTQSTHIDPTMDPDRRKKPVTVTGPFIVYMLREEEILDDWAAIKKAMQSRKKMSL